MQEAVWDGAADRVHWMGQEKEQSSIVSRNIRRGDESYDKSLKEYQRRLKHLDDFSDFVAAVKPRLVTSTELAQQEAERQKREKCVAMLSSAMGAAIQRENCCITCYYCGSTIAVANYEQHVDSCRFSTEQLLRKHFHNPLRLLPRPLQLPIPSSESSKAELATFDETAIEALKGSMVPCPRCSQKFVVHDLQSHVKRCLGKTVFSSSGERGLN